MVSVVDYLFGQTRWWLTTGDRLICSVETRRKSKVCVVGCGRWLHGDDQIGLLVAQSLQKLDLPDTRIVLTESPAADLADQLEGVSLLILIDAARPDITHPPGKWTRIDYVSAPGRLRARSTRDTHGLGVDMALQIVRALGRLPSEVSVYAISAGACRPGTGITVEVQRAGQTVLRQIADEIRKFVKAHGENDHA